MRTWGIILQRNISHANEQAFWPQNRHAIAGRLTQDMAADGFSDIEHGQNLQFEPYVLGRNLRQLNTIDPTDPYFQSKHFQGYSGLDAKFILHNSLILDTTVNPDFSQVGIDNPAIPNQRFPPYFAEVRPFFIENSSYFQTPVASARTAQQYCWCSRGSYRGLEVAAVFNKERPHLREVGRKALVGDSRVVDAHLAEVRVDGGVEDQAVVQDKLCIQAGITLKMLTLKVGIGGVDSVSCRRLRPKHKAQIEGSGRARYR